MGIQPRVKTQSEPISELTKVTDPIKIEDTGGTQIDLTTKQQLMPLAVASQHGTAEAANTDILATDITPTNTPCLFRIMVMLETAGVFSAQLKNGGTTKVLKFNTAVQLLASCAYMFDLLVHSGDTVNFQTDVSGNVILRVQEIVGGVQ